MKLCIGTVQFGMNYGVFDQKKKEPEYCIKCLDYATQNGILAIDTATAYGTAERVVGDFLKRKTVPREKLFISTKLLPNVLDDCKRNDYEYIIQDNLERSLKTLNTDYVDAYFLHSSRYAFNSEIIDALYSVKKKGMARKVGVSIYYPDEAEACFDRKKIQYLQMPYSIFDHRMKEKDIFEKAYQLGIDVDVRTVFVKGLIKLEYKGVPDYLSGTIPILRKLDDICEETGFSRIELAMGYIKREKTLNHLVFGVRTIEQLKEDIDSFKKKVPEEILRKMDVEFFGIPADIVVPSLWVK